MVQIVIILIVSLAAAFTEIPSLRKAGARKDSFAFICLLSFAALMGILQVLKMELPNPFELVDVLLTPVTKVILNILK